MPYLFHLPRLPRLSFTPTAIGVATFAMLASHAQAEVLTSTEVPAPLQGVWASSNVDCTKSSSLTIGQQEIKFGNDLTEPVRVLSTTSKENNRLYSIKIDTTSQGNYDFELTSGGKLILDNDQLYAKCSDKDNQQRKAYDQKVKLSKRVEGVWMDPADKTQIAFYFEPSYDSSEEEEEGPQSVTSGTYVLVMNGTTPFSFNLSDIDPVRNTVTIRQDSSTSNSVWTLQFKGDEINPSMNVITNSPLAYDMGFVRKITDGDIELKDKLIQAFSNPKSNSGAATVRDAATSAVEATVAAVAATAVDATAPARSGGPSGPSRPAMLKFDNVNVRSAPWGSVQCVIDKKGSSVQIYKARTDDNGMIWYETSACSGQRGFIAASQLVR